MDLMLFLVDADQQDMSVINILKNLPLDGLNLALAKTEGRESAAENGSYLQRRWQSLRQSMQEAASRQQGAGG